ncbi:ATP-binding cassette domain-containing protein [bacterium]|nr:ATP-binding cassette domain-containing protein [bacterium]
MRDLVFGWGSGRAILDIETFRVDRGERVFLRGPSGSGKSTLLGVISGVLEPRAGEVELFGERLGALSASRRDRLRGAELGVIFQLFNLVPYLSVTENVVLPCRLSAERARRVKETGRSLDAEAKRLLDRLGLGAEALLRRRVTDLSVGQQQRVAAARALMGGPSLIIADEPTSSLDIDARERFVDLLKEGCAERGSALLFVSHDTTLSAQFDRVVDLAAINRARVEEAA